MLINHYNPINMMLIIVHETIKLVAPNVLQNNFPIYI